MIFLWILTVILSVIIGVVLTLVVQYCIFIKHSQQQETISLNKKFKLEPFKLPKVLLDVIQCDQLVFKESCIALNLLLQFLFHELRDTEKVRLWFRNKLCLEFEELLSKSTIGKMVGNIKILKIDLGSEFPVINNVAIHNVKVNKDYSHIDTLDLKLDVNYSGGFKLMVEANMLLGKAVIISIQVEDLYGEGRLQFTRLPYSHWSFTFFDEPKIQLHVESHFQGRPFYQITNFISSQIKKSLKKKHTLPNYKICYKPFFSIAENFVQSSNIPAGQLLIVIHKISRLNEIEAENCEIYCTLAIDSLPWVEIVNYKKTNYYVLDIIVTKKNVQNVGLIFRQEFVKEKNQVCVIIDDIKVSTSFNSEEICRNDIVLFIDGKKVNSPNHAQKYIKSAAIQFTVRVERKVRNKIMEENIDENYETAGLSGFNFLSSEIRKRKNSEDESRSSSPTLFTGSHKTKSLSKNPSSETIKTKTVQSKTVISEDVDSCTKILKTKFLPNKQIIVFEENFVFNVKDNSSRYLNLNVRGNENNSSSKDKLLGFVNIPLIEIQHASDTLRCIRLKPPDSFAASNIQSHRLLNNNGFIPLLCYGDVVLTLQYIPKDIKTNSFKSVPEIIEPTLIDNSEIALELPLEEKKHDFIKTHFQTSTQCEFCGKKIWLKDAEKCRNCGMSCHKKCVSKCRADTVCKTHSEILGERNRQKYGNEEELLLSDLSQSGNTSTQENQSTPSKKRLGSLLATVASASRGLKRVGSANSLALPGDSFQNSSSRSLPHSPQHSPAPSRKASLPVEMNEEITALLQTLMEHGPDQKDMMDFAKETGKSLFEDLDIAERKDKINEMINKLKVVINAEADIRFALTKEEQLENEPGKKAKIAFLLGKSDEKTQALSVVILHLCAGLQHIQDIEDQEKENQIDEVIKTTGEEAKE